MSLSSKLAHTNILIQQWRDLCIYKIRFLRARILKRSSPTVILCYPEKPTSRHQLSIMAHHMGWTISQNPKAHFNRVVAFADTTIRRDDSTLAELLTQNTVINAQCANIRKTRLEEIFHEVFGYGMAVDPLTYTGAYVRKSDTNGRHDGMLLYAPTQPVEGYVYQRLINNQTAPGVLEELRVGVCGKEIAFVLQKHRDSDDRFDTKHWIGMLDTARLVDTDIVLSTQERSDIVRFCKAFGLDYGELDILRDRDDGHIYVADVNNTPMTPLRGIQMTAKDHDVLIEYENGEGASHSVEAPGLVILISHSLRLQI